MATLNKTLSLLYPESFLSYLSSLRILVVGAGGIGCELLKVLSKFSFASLTIIDLDTIEVSNLNRQFLFRKEHKGLSKAHVAKATLEALNPALAIESHQANIKDFGISFFKGFEVIFSALDNAEARSYINSMCVALGKPLLEAGTTGFKGQAMLLRRGMTRCYDCEAKGQSKTYQVCTIRTLPEKPLHCVIWAKYLFGVLFGPCDESNLLEDLRESLNSEGENLAEKVFEELYGNQIQKQRDSDPKKFEKLAPLELSAFRDAVGNEEILEEKAETKQRVFSVGEYVQLFLWAFRKLLELKKTLGFVSFEKDDDLCIKFITAASNLRSRVFGIELQNEFQTKEIAGNIIPAICSTNAIVAAIEVSEALKYLRFLHLKAEKTGNKECYVQNDLEKKINPINPLKPNPKCLVCQESLIPCLVFVNMESFTLGDFFSRIVSRLTLESNGTPSFTLMQQNLIIFEQGDYLDEDEVESNQKKLVQTLFSIFKTLKDITTTLTINESLFVKFSIVHDVSLSGCCFSLENDVSARKSLGDLKSMMVDSKIDYEEQVKREEEQKKQGEKSLRENNGVFEIADESGEENGSNGKKADLKRERPAEASEDIEILDEKPSKKTKIG